jgi:hypothetical protein
VFTFDVSKLVTFTQQNPLNIMRQACQKPTLSAISSNPPSSTSPTSSQGVTSIPKPMTNSATSHTDSQEVTSNSNSTTPARTFSSNISSVTKSTAQSTITTPPSDPYCVPDNFREASLDRCSCSGSITVSPNAVSGEPECPQTSPGTEWKTVVSPTLTPTSDTGPSLPFTTTNIVGDIQLCTSIKTTEYANLPVTECFGPTLTTHTLPYATGICNIHIHEYADHDGGHGTFAAKIDAYDGSGALVHTIDQHDQWPTYGTTLTIPKGPFLSDINIDFLAGKASTQSNKRNRISEMKRQAILPVGLDYDVQISVDAATVWSTKDRDTTKYPHCEVGDWDTHDNAGEDLFWVEYPVPPVRICFLSHRSNYDKTSSS